MGYIFDQRIQITLSPDALNILNQDEYTFLNHHNHSNIINIIFENYYKMAKVNIYEEMFRQKDQLKNSIDFYNRNRSCNMFANHIYPDTKLGNILFFNEESKRVFKAVISANALTEKLIVDKICSSHGESIRIRLNNTVYKILYDESNMSICELKKIFLKERIILRAIIEEYCSLPFFERESIIYKKRISQLNHYISWSNNYTDSNRNGIRFQYTNNKGYTTEITTIPYKICTDSFTQYHFLLGYTKSIDYEDQYSPNLYRISRINNLSESDSTLGILSESDIEILEDYMINRDSRIRNQAIDAEIVMTKNGQNLFNNILYRRPLLTKISEDAHGNIHYFFHDSEFAISNYFIQFTEDALIIKPLSLRNKFLCHYKNAFDKYKNEL